MFKNVYIVEQSAPLKIMLKTMFRAGGFPVKEAFETVPSIDEIDTEATWLVVHVTDDNQEKLLSFLEEISASDKKIQVSVIIAKSDHDFFPLLASLGALSYFEFPMTSESLKNEIEEFKEMSDSNIAYPNIAVHYVRKLYRSDSMYSAWKDFESQLVESQYRSKFIDTMARFQDIYKGLNSNSKVEEVQSILKAYSNEANLESLEKKIRVLAYNRLEDLDRISYLLKKDLFEVTRVVDWSSRPSNADDYDFILVDWDYKAMPWPYIVSSARQDDRFILFNVPSEINMENIFDYKISVAISKDSNPESALESIIYEYFSYGLKRNYYKEKIDFLNNCYSVNIEPLKLNYKNCIAYCKTYKINSIALFDSEYSLATGQTQKAKKIAENYFEDFGESPWILELLGRIYLKLGDKEKAIPILERVIFQNSEDIDILCRISEKYAEVGDEKLSERYLDRASSLDSNSLSVIETNLKTKVIFGHPDGVKGLIDKIPNLNRVVSYLNNLAVSYAALGDFSRGLGLYNDAITIVGAHDKEIMHIISYNVAICYLRAKDYQSSLSILDNPDLDPKIFGERRQQLKSNILKFSKQGEIQKLYDHFTVKHEKNNNDEIVLGGGDSEDSMLGFNLKGIFFPKEIRTFSWKEDKITQKRSAA